MKSPKLLPWLANTSGLSLTRVEELWQDASQHAERVTGEVATHRYWSAAHQKLINLVDAEAFAQAPAESASGLMLATHISMGLLVATDALSQLSRYMRAWLNQLSQRPA